MPLDRARKIMFLHIPKTGGTSVESALGICGIDNDGSNEFSEELQFGLCDGIYSQHLTGRELISILGEDASEYRAMSFVRNPYSRLLSAYFASTELRQLRKWRPKAGFRKFVGELLPAILSSPIESDPARHFRPQYLFLDGVSQNVAAIKVGKFESLNEDFKGICESFNIDGSLSHKNRREGSERRSKSDFYDGATTSKVYELYKRDFIEFGYQEQVPTNS